MPPEAAAPRDPAETARIATGTRRAQPGRYRRLSLSCPASVRALHPSGPTSAASGGWAAPGPAAPRARALAGRQQQSKEARLPQRADLRAGAGTAEPSAGRPSAARARQADRGSAASPRRPPRARGSRSRHGTADGMTQARCIPRPSRAQALYWTGVAAHPTMPSLAEAPARWRRRCIRARNPAERSPCGITEPL